MKKYINCIKINTRGQKEPGLPGSPCFDVVYFKVYLNGLFCYVISLSDFFRPRKPPGGLFFK